MLSIVYISSIDPACGIAQEAKTAGSVLNPIMGKKSVSLWENCIPFSTFPDFETRIIILQQLAPQYLMAYSIFASALGTKNAHATIEADARNGLIRYAW